MLGVFLDEASVNRGDLDIATLQGSLEQWRSYPGTSAEETAQRVHDAQVVVSNKVVLDAEVLARAKALRLICIAATGTNNVDLTAANRQGIVVCNVRAYATPSVVQHVFALLLSLVTRLNDYQCAVAVHRWEASRQFCLLDYPISELAGKVVGIVGYGELGRAVGTVAEAFGMRVVVAARVGGAAAPGRVPLAELLPQVDVLTLHCPLSNETRGLIGARELALMKPTAILINTARGGIVDEAALAAALCAGRLGGAGVDVLGVEPPVVGNPLLTGGVPNLIVTPHIAWASRESRQRLLNDVAANISAFRAGRPRNVVASG